MAHKKTHWEKYSAIVGQKRSKHMSLLGKALKTRRERKRPVPTQKSIADKIEVKPSTYSGYENGTIDMPYSALPIILESLDISVFDIIKDIYPPVRDLLKDVRDFLADLMIERGINPSPLAPLYGQDPITGPTGYSAGRTFTLFADRPEDVEEEIRMSYSRKTFIGDPIISVADSIVLLRSADISDEEREMVTRVLLQSLLKHYQD